MKSGMVVREKRLIPVTTKPKNAKLEKLLGGVQRSTLRDEVLVCAMVSPDGKTGVFLDDTGREYLIKEDELSDKLEYITSKYVKKLTPRFVRAKRDVSQYEELVREFLTRPDTSKRYIDWLAPDGFDQVEISSTEIKTSEVSEETDSSCIRIPVDQNVAEVPVGEQEIDIKQSIDRVLPKTISSKAVDDDTFIIYKEGRKYPYVRVSSEKIELIVSGSRVSHAVETLALSKKVVKDTIIYYIWLAFDEDCIVADESKNELLCEEGSKYERGKTYTSDDGEFKFKVLSVRNGEVQIQDIKTKIKCKVEVSDLELLNPICEELNENTQSYDDYKFKWTAANGEKNFTVYKGQKRLATYAESEYDIVIKAINKGTFEKELDSDLM